MAKPASPATLVFGAFELDAETGELRKSGLRVKLGDRELQVLLALIESPGVTVTREDLQHRLWRDHTTVDFENNLNNAISRLRSALGDSSQSPRFIETVPRHGYRFVAPVTRNEMATPAHPSWWRSRTVLVGLVIVVVATGGLVFRTLAIRSRVIGSLALLPITKVNSSRGAAKDYLSRAVTDAILLDVSKVRGLRVVPMKTAVHYAQSGKTPVEIAGELHVDAIARCSVRPQGDALRINLQLVRGRDGALIWYGSFQDQISDYPKLAHDATKGIIQAAGLHLTQQQREEDAAGQSQTDPQAKDAYLKGRYYMRQLTEASRSKARNYFEQAVAIAPDFAPAYVGLADYYETTDTISPRIAIPKAKSYALKALRINNALSSAHTALAVAYFYEDWNWDESEREFRRALQLDPNSERAHRMYAALLSCTGHVQEAVSQIQKAHQIDPLSIPVFDMASTIWLNAHQYDQSIQQANQILELNPESAIGHEDLGKGDLFRGKLQEAVEEFKRAAGDGGLGPLMTTLLGFAYARLGKRKLAQGELLLLTRWSEQRYVPPVWIAMVYAGMGSKRKALASLDRAFRHRGEHTVFIKVSPFLDSLHNEPRFQDLIQRMDFPG